MPEFNANEDFQGLSGFGEDEPLEVPKLRLRFMPRTRELAGERCFRSRAHGPIVQRWRAPAVRRPCALLGADLPTAIISRRRRRLWATCRGGAPGSPS